MFSIKAILDVFFEGYELSMLRCRVFRTFFFTTLFNVSMALPRKNTGVMTEVLHQLLCVMFGFDSHLFASLRICARRSRFILTFDSLIR